MGVTMERFMGMMPRPEVEMELTFYDRLTETRVVVQAGPRGWAVLYADGSAEYRDVEASTEENFREAFGAAGGGTWGDLVPVEPAREGSR